MREPDAPSELIRTVPGARRMMKTRSRDLILIWFPAFWNVDPLQGVHPEDDAGTSAFPVPRQASCRKSLTESHHSEDFLCRKLPFCLTCGDLNCLGLNLVTCNQPKLKYFITKCHSATEVKKEAC